MKIALTGATGLIGRALVAMLRKRGDHVLALVRDPARARTQLSPGTECVTWDAATAEGAWVAAMQGSDAVIHLAGEPISGGRWTESKKRRLWDSRVDGTRHLVEAIGAMPSSARPGVFVCASGVDYYGDSGEIEKPEGSPPGETFLSKLCVAWEAEAEKSRAHGLRVTCVRTGVVLGEKGGALEQMITPFKMFVGGPVGSGRQWFPWLHLTDMLAMYLTALDDPRYTEPFNAVTHAVRMAEFSETLGKVMNRPSWLPVPGFALRIALGEMGAMLMESKRVVPATLRERGFEWRFADLEQALRDVIA